MRSRDGSGSTTASIRERASLTSCLRRAGLTPCVAGCTGTSPSVCTGASPFPISSCSVTQNWLRWRSLPWSSTIAPCAELTRHPGLVEPDGNQRTGLVEDARLHALLAAVAHRLDRRGPNRDRNGGLLAHHQLGHSPHLTPVPVRVREVLHQFAPGCDGERLEPVNRLGEDARARVGPNGVGAQLVRGQGLVGCKANRQVIHMIAVTAGGRGGTHGCSYQHDRLPGGRRH